MNRILSLIHHSSFILHNFLIRLLYRRHPVKVSGGWVKVRRLALYELDAIPFEDPGPFEYEYVLGNGQRVKRVHDISQWPTPPKPPGIAEADCLPGSLEAGLWHIWHVYQSAWSQRLRRQAAAETHARQTALYIVQKCLSPSDQAKIKIPGDYPPVCKVALNPEVDVKEIEAALADSFPGYMGWFAYS